MRGFLIAVVSALLLSANAFAQPVAMLGSADEARAMLKRAIAAVRADKNQAIGMFNRGEGGFLEGDLYPFCIQVSDGLIVAQGGPLTDEFVGRSIRPLTDAVGKAYGEEIFAAAQGPEGEVTEVRYSFPRPSDKSLPVPKISFIQPVGDLACGVGYYQ